ncbi:hypothetical protein TNCV_4593381 [Trichonephila clavipes]|uniref:Uncharacterized protein n=1 Tax=Trichonephila clavipes TaxID=2585209 RepID=A0A8X6WGM7_TRICX|nr:hypothetical protein TNCV_4593381 [Trichonephila clavipes]
MDSPSPSIPGQVGLDHVMVPSRTCSCYLPKLVSFASRYEVKASLQEALREIAKNGFQLCFRSYTNAGRSVSSPKGTTLKVDVFRCCELFRVSFAEIMLWLHPVRRVKVEVNCHVKSEKAQDQGWALSRSRSTGGPPRHFEVTAFTKT